MLKKIIPVAAAAMLVFGGAANAAELSLHGSTTVSSNLLLPYETDIEAKSGHDLTIISNGSSRGIDDLVAGKADMGMISAPLETVAGKMNRKEPGSVDASQLQAHQVGTAQVAFTVHPANSVKNLTLEQVTNILNGTITNWNEVGGPDAPLIVVAEDSKGGLRAMVEDELLAKKPITAAQLREMPNGTQIPKVVAQIPTSIGVMSAALVDESIVALETDEVIAQPLILITKGEPTPEMTEVIEAARSFGQ